MVPQVERVRAKLDGSNNIPRISVAARWKGGVKPAIHAGCCSGPVGAGARSRRRRPARRRGTCSYLRVVAPKKSNLIIFNSFDD